MHWPLAWRSRAERAERELVGVKAMLQAELVKNADLRLQLLQAIHVGQAAAQAALRRNLAGIGKGRK